MDPTLAPVTASTMAYAPAPVTANHTDPTLATVTVTYPNPAAVTDSLIFHRDETAEPTSADLDRFRVPTVVDLADQSGTKSSSSSTEHSASSRLVAPEGKRRRVAPPTGEAATDSRKLSRKRSIEMTIRLFNFSDKFIKDLKKKTEKICSEITNLSVAHTNGATMNSFQLVQVSNWVYNALKNKTLAIVIGYVECVFRNVTSNYCVLPGIFTVYGLGQHHCVFSPDDMKIDSKRRELIELFLELLEQSKNSN
jgi:hypothetical protein